MERGRDTPNLQDGARDWMPKRPILKNEGRLVSVGIMISDVADVPLCPKAWFIDSYLVQVCGPWVLYGTRFILTTHPESLQSYLNS